MQTRNDINWAPFNSIINGKYIVKEIEKKFLKNYLTFRLKRCA